MESLESDTDEKRASLLSVLSKVHYIIQKNIRKKQTFFNEIHNFLIAFYY